MKLFTVYPWRIIENDQILFITFLTLLCEEGIVIMNCMCVSCVSCISEYYNSQIAFPIELPLFNEKYCKPLS